MAQRVIVYTICRLIEMAGAGTGPMTDDFWVECTEEGSAKIAKVKAERDNAGNNSKTSVVQYHVYYQDGGHARFKERYYLAEEKALFPSLPTDDPASLYPAPEFIPVAEPE